MSTSKVLQRIFPNVFVKDVRLGASSVKVIGDRLIRNILAVDKFLMWLKMTSIYSANSFDNHLLLGYETVLALGGPRKLRFQAVITSALTLEEQPSVPRKCHLYQQKSHICA